MEKRDEMNILRELDSLHENLEKAKTKEEKEMINSQIKSLKDLLNKKKGFDVSEKSVIKKLPVNKNIESPRSVYTQRAREPLRGPKLQNKGAKKSVKKPIVAKPKIQGSIKDFKLSKFEKETLRRLRKKEKKLVGAKLKKPSKYVNLANTFFADYSAGFLKKGNFKKVERDLVKTSLQFMPKTYISVIFFTTFLSAIVALFVFLFFLFFNLSSVVPFISFVDENLIIRFLKVFWILVLIPAVTFLFMYMYPSLERKSAETKINHELPFATIHMSSISGSMVEPSKIFEIIISTHEYPNLEKEFKKLINQINVLGYDLVTALRTSAFNSPSKKLAELFNGLSTTISSGGDLANFFEKRSQTFLFDYRLDREKKTRSAETFMDIYISVVIAAPMVLMLLLMMMKISGLGIALSTSAITLIMVLGVSAINVAFLTFLHLKGAGE